MAEVVRTYPQPVPQINSVELLLSRDEAEFIVDVFARVGGNADVTRRACAAVISSALREAFGGRFGGSAKDITGTIECHNRPRK
jgi:hypothetical protein